MRFSGHFHENFFSKTIKANGRAGFSALPFSNYLPEPEKPSGAKRIRDLKTKKTKKERN
jgi:hypothetical protein